MTTSLYLPHLDGLRAIALTGVLLFHFRVPSFQGGFSGVDVFLSLSGFLITRNILRDLSNQTFSLRSFYLRRFYRLYPASLVTVALALILALFAFPPPLARSTSASGLAALQFTANIFFHAQANYFDAAAITKPLLHMWSLSLEEQYYFLWAPLLVITYRFATSIKFAAAILFLLFSASLALGITLYSSHPSFVFYELPARIFQFAAGALVAILNGPNASSDDFPDVSLREPDVEASEYKPVPTNDGDDHSDASVTIKEDDGKLISNNIVSFFEDHQSSIPFRCGKEVLATLSIGGLFASYVLLPLQASPLQMTPTTICTCIAIMLPNTLLSRYILSNPVLRYFGRISYSAYLVHWPIWVFAVHGMSALRLGPPNPAVMVVVTMLTASLLRETVETTYRQGKHGIRIAVATALVVCLALVGILTDGYAFRFGNIDFDLSNAHQAGLLVKFCKDESGAPAEVLPGYHVKTCRVGDLNGTRSNYAFFGDSFTLHLAGALDGIGKRRREWYELHFQSGCHFLPQSARGSIKDTRFHCRSRHDELWNDLKGLENGTIVAVANSWGSGKLAEKTFPSFVNDISSVGHRTAMVAEPPGLSGKEGHYFDCADFAVMPISRLWQIFKKGKFEGAKQCARLEEGLTPFGGRVGQAIAYRNLAKTLVDVELIEIFDQLCNQENGDWRCRVPQMDGMVYDIGYRRDRHHLTEGGSVALSRVYEQAIFMKNDSLST